MKVKDIVDEIYPQVAARYPKLKKGLLYKLLVVYFRGVDYSLSAKRGFLIFKHIIVVPSHKSYIQKTLSKMSKKKSG